MTSNCRRIRSRRLPAKARLGGKYLALTPGTAEFIAPGGLIRDTRNYRSLEDQVGEIIFLATNKPEQPR